MSQPLRFTAASMNDAEAERADFLSLLNAEIAARTRQLEREAGLVRVSAGARAVVEILGWTAATWTRPP